MGLLTLNHIQQTLAHSCCHGNEVAVPRAPISQHGQFGSQGGGEGAGGEENGFALHDGNVSVVKWMREIELNNYRTRQA